MGHQSVESHRAERHARAHQILKQAGYSAYKRGGHTDEAEDKKMMAGYVHKHEKHDHPGTKLTKFKTGGAVHGKHAKAHAHKKGRGSHVTIVVGANDAEKRDAMHKGAALGAMMAARKMAGPPMGAGPGGPPMPPPGPGAVPPGPPGMPPMKRGGAVHLNGGSGGGRGRIGKALSYGDGSIKVKSHLRKYPHKKGGRV